MEQAVELDEKINGVLADVLGVPLAVITDDLAMRDVGAWDSLKHMELILSLEETFGLQLSFDEIVNMQNVGNIRQTLERRAKS